MKINVDKDMAEKILGKHVITVKENELIKSVDGCFATVIWVF